MTGSRSLEEIEAFVRLTDGISDFGDMRHALQQEVVRLGFEAYSYWQLCPADGPREIFYLSTYPASWITYYVAQSFKNHDIIANHSAMSVSPFLWDGLLARYALSKTQSAVFGDAREFGLKAGGSIPIHGPRSAHACFTVSSDCSAGQFSELFQVHRYQLQLIALYAHEKIVKLQSEHATSAPNLTARELEVLTWTAKGKTRWEIGEILHISEDTVKKHLLSASNRLGVSNKTHAVSRALLHRLIIP